MESFTRFITQDLKLKVNEAKSALARPQERRFLAFSFTAGPEVKRVIAPKALDRFKRRIREITGGAKGVSMMTTMERSWLLLCGAGAVSSDSAKRLKCRLV
jgi:RNA-directed DNA polymerase